MRGLRFKAGLAVVVVVVVLMLAVGGAAAGPVPLDLDADLDGNGTAGDPYIVTNASELQAMENNLTAHYKLGNDITASETAGWNNGNGFKPVGSGYNTRFTGHFDGDGHTISDLYINRTSEDYVGIFGYVDSDGIIKNVGFENVSVNGDEVVGGVVGWNSGTVSELYATGSVNGNKNVGGLVGANVDGKVNESYATGSINSSESVGGLVGYNDGEVKESYATGSVNGSDYIGGLVGINIGGEVNESYATGSVDNAISDDEFPYVGGLIGWNYGGNVSGSYATGNVTLDGSGSVGGLIASNDGDVRNSYWDTETTEQDDSDGGEGLSTEDMTGDRAADTMFEFGDTWDVVDTNSDDGREVSYPFLVDNEQDPAPSLQTIPFYAGGDGSISSPYEITDWHELEKVRENLDANFTLSNELNGTTAGYDEVASQSANDGKGFEPIGNNSDRFAGHFDGSGHSVLDLHIDRSSDNFVGLFGAIDGGTVENVEVENVTIDGSGSVSGLVGLNVGVVANSSAAGSVEGTDSVGGLVGDNRGEVRESSTAGSVAGTTNIGGLIGINNGEVHESSAASSVTGSDRVGGLVGDNINSQVSESYATGTVDGGDRAGGLVGRNLGPDAVVNTSYAVGDVSAEQNPDNPGGLVGSNENDATIEDAYWDIGTTNRSEAVGNPAATETTLVGFGEIGDTEPAAEMQGLNAIFEMHRLDFDSTWWGRIGPDDYPGLKALETGLDPTIDVTNEPVNEGETLTVDVTVTNTDSTERTQAVTLSVDGEAVDIETDLTVLGDESQKVTLEWKTDSGDAGEHDIVVATADTADVATVQVNEAYNVSGTVEDTTFETGIGDIEVTVSGVPGEYTAETDENGEYTVKNVPETDESYDVIVDQEGWDRASTTTAVKDENVTGVDLEITGDARDSITLRDGVTDEPLEGTTVRIEEDTLGIVENAFVADEDGKMEIVVPGTFTYAYTFSKPGYRNAEIPSRSFDPGDKMSANYVLGGNAEITGTVTDEVTGVGIEKATVTAQNGAGAYTAETNGAGAFTIENVPGGHDYDLTFEADGYNANSSFAVTVGDGATAEVDGTLLAESLFAVEITETNSPVPVGRTLAVNATVTNRGESDTQTVTLNDTGFDDQQRDDRKLTLEPGESEIVTLEWQIAENYVGEGAVSVATANESVDASVTIESMYAGGNGIEDDPYQIETWYHLHNVRKNLDSEFVLNNDLNESTDGYDEVASETADNSAGFDPIGTNSERFEGTINGNSHTVSNLTINRSEKTNVGLFGVTDGDSIVENVGLVDVDIHGDNQVGGLVGFLGAGATVSESYVSGTVDGNRFVGGLVGYNYRGTVSESYAISAVEGNENVGGLVGENFEGTVSESYATGTVDGTDYVGGLVGFNDGDVENAYWDSGTTNQDEAIGDGGAGGTTGFGDTSDTDPAPEMQRFAPLVTMDALSFESPETWTLSGGYPRLEWESVDPLTVDSLEAHDTTAIAGTETQITVTANEGGTNTGAGVTVTLGDNGSLEGPPAGTTSVTDANGNATFAFNETSADDYDLEFAWEADPALTDSATVTVESADAASITVETQPAQSIAGESIAGPPAVTATDDFGNTVEGVTVAAEAKDGNGELTGGGLTVATDENGIATFDDIEIEVAGEGYRLEFSIDAAEENVVTNDAIETDTFDIETADADSLSIVDAPDSITAGGSVTLTIQVVDRFDNPIADQTLADFEVVSEHDGEMFSDESLTPDGDGNATVTIAADGITSAAIDHTLTATAADVNGDTADIDVGAGDADTLEILDTPDTMTAGDSVDLVIDVTDQYENPASGQQLSGVTVASEHDDEVFSVVSLALDDSGQAPLSIAEGGVTTADGKHTLTVSTDSGITDSVDLEVLPTDTVAVELYPADGQTVTAGGTVEFDASAFDAYDNLVEDDTTAFTWRNATNGAVDETVAGSYKVTATLEGVSSETVTVMVEPATVDSIQLEPAETQTIEAGETVEFSATAYDEFDNLVEDDDTAFGWENAADGTFDETAADNYNVTATLDDVVSEPVTVTVEAAVVDTVEIDAADDQTITAGNELDFSATALDAYDNLVTDENAEFTWQNATAGAFEETTAGSYDVTAMLEDVSSEVMTVTVDPAAVETVEITPDAEQPIEAGEEVAFDATAFDAYDNIVENSNAEFTWTNATDGTFEQTIAGTYSVTGTIDDVTSEATTVTVEPAAVETVEIEPGAEQTIEAGEKLEFDATAYDAFENVVEDSNAAFTWTDATIGGVFENTTPGTYAVTATVDSVTSPQTNVTVQAPSNFNVSIDGYPTGVVEGDSVDAEVTITNVGDLEGTQNVRLSDFDGNEVDSQSVTLTAGENSSATLVWQTDSSDVGAGKLTVTTDNESAVTETIVVEAETPRRSASFDVTIYAVTDTVTEGEPITVNATIKNSGERRGTQQVTLSNFADEVVDTTEISLSRGEETSISLSWDTTIGDAGEGSLIVRSEDETATTHTVVLEKSNPAIFELTDPEVPPAVEVGETFDVSVVVTNTGDRVGEQRLVVSVDEVDLEETTLLTLEGNESVRMALENVSVDTAGVYTVELSSDDDSLSGSVTVREGEADADDESGDEDGVAGEDETSDVGGADSEDKPGETDAGVADETGNEDGESAASDGLPGFGVVLTLFVLLVATLVSDRWRSRTV
ncbi:GLUG motif-containing protein [Natrialbaceae archaeon A-CW2]